MLSMEELGYLLYMEECDHQEEQKKRDRESAAAALSKYQVESEQLLEAEIATYNDKLRRF